MAAGASWPGFILIPAALHRDAGGTVGCRAGWARPGGVGLKKGKGPKRPTATKSANAPRTALMTTACFSPRLMWVMMAPTITTARPVAATGTIEVAIPVTARAGSGPQAQGTSAQADGFYGAGLKSSAQPMPEAASFLLRAWVIFIEPAARKARARAEATIQRVMFHDDSYVV